MTDTELDSDHHPIVENYQQRAEASYHDTHYPQRYCDHCDNPYTGPAVFCSLRCAVAAA
jgi:hypothetical protein